MTCPAGATRARSRPSSRTAISSRCSWPTGRRRRRDAAPGELDPRLARRGRRLARDLPRLDPSFRFEEALAARSRAAVARIPVAARWRRLGRLDARPRTSRARRARGRRRHRSTATSGPARAAAAHRGRAHVGRPLAGRCAWVAWRWRRPRRLPMARAVRAVAGDGWADADQAAPFRAAAARNIPPDLWTQCPDCQEMLYNKQLDKALRVCPHCGHHFRLPRRRPTRAAARSRQLVRGARRRPRVGRPARLRRPEAVSRATGGGPGGDGHARRRRLGQGAIGGTRVAICVMDFAFMGGSMGAVVGEKVTRAAECALASGCR